MILATLFAYDFDGTLAPIVSQPDAARMLPETERALVTLSQRAPVVVISGRSLEDLARRVPLPRSNLIGNHGLEGLGADSAALTRAILTTSKWAEQLSRFVDRPSNRLPPGAWIENKGASLSIHTRACSDAAPPERVIKRLLEICQTLTPMPRIIGGKKILNLIPPGSPNKGDALLAALRSQSPKSARHAFYAGDDETDEDVFRLVGTHPITTLRVGFEPSSRAQAFITEQHQILKILHGQIASLLR